MIFRELHEPEVSLIGIYGDDNTIAQSAWTSTNTELTPEMLKRVPSLLRQLLLKDHHTPFEKPKIHVRICTSRIEEIHILKHRIGVEVNGESQRYKPYREKKYYIPYDFPEDLKEMIRESTRDAFVREESLRKDLIARGFTPQRARESSRYLLPANLCINLDVAFNFRSFMHFYLLRSHPSAQVEIQLIAKKLLTILEESERFPHAIAAFFDYLEVQEIKEGLMNAKIEEFLNKNKKEGVTC